MKKKIFKIKTLGCKVNQSESAAIAAKLKSYGYEQWCAGETITNSTADQMPVNICIINTCTVTEKASMQSRQAIRQAIRNHPGAKIIVTGCYAQTQPEELAKIDGIDDIIGHFEKHTIPERIVTPLPCPSATISRHASVPNAADAFPCDQLPEFDHRTRAFLKIQDGCDARCTYCIVPRARGASRSMPVHQVHDKLKQINKNGHKEIVLTGIHLGRYGKDLSPKTDLWRLLLGIEASDITSRIRLSSIEPREITEDIIALISRSEKICRHFHIPLQSGDDGILREMGRPYTASFFRDLVSMIHQRMPTSAIGVDTLIGFPGESDAAFHHTYAVIESLPITYLHVFPFSPRQTTPAYDFPDQVSPGIIKERCKIIRLLGIKKKRRFYADQIGNTLNVLVESSADKKTGRLRGNTSNYVPVFFRGNEALKNTMVPVLVERLWGERGVIGRLIE